MPARKIIGLGVIAPQLFAGGGVERVDITPGSRGVHDAVDDDGGRFLAALGIAQVVLPGEAQLLDVLRIDAGQGRVVAAVLVAPAGEPVLRLPVRPLQARGIEVSGRRRRCGGGHRSRCRRERRAGEQQSCEPPALMSAGVCFGYDQGGLPCNGVKLSGQPPRTVPPPPQTRRVDDARCESLRLADASGATAMPSRAVAESRPAAASDQCGDGGRKIRFCRQMDLKAPV